MSKPPVVEINTIATTVVDEVIAVQRRYGLTHVVFAETRPCSHESDGEAVRDVNVRLAIPTERVAAICAALMAGETAPAIDEGRATVEGWGRA